MIENKHCRNTVSDSVAGVESEVHIFALGGAPAKLRREASRIVRQAVLRRRGLWRCRGCKDSCDEKHLASSDKRCFDAGGSGAAGAARTVTSAVGLSSWPMGRDVTSTTDTLSTPRRAPHLLAKWWRP